MQMACYICVLLFVSAEAPVASLHADFGSDVDFLHRLKAEAAQAAREDRAAVDGNVAVLLDDSSGAGRVDQSGGGVACDQKLVLVIHPVVVGIFPNEIVKAAIVRVFLRFPGADARMYQEKRVPADADFIENRERFQILQNGCLLLRGQRTVTIPGHVSAVIADPIEKGIPNDGAFVQIDGFPNLPDDPVEHILVVPKEGDHVGPLHHVPDQLDPVRAAVSQAEKEIFSNIRWNRS